MGSRRPAGNAQLSLGMELGDATQVQQMRPASDRTGPAPRRRSGRAKAPADAPMEAPAPSALLEPANQEQAAVLEHLATALAAGAIRAARRELVGNE